MIFLSIVTLVLTIFNTILLIAISASVARFLIRGEETPKKPVAEQVLPPVDLFEQRFGPAQPTQDMRILRNE